MLSRANNKFSWSISRYNLFNFCERAYYFHYYGSWNGFEKNYDPQSAKLFMLKNLQPKESWISSILNTAFYAAISRRINPEFKIIRKLSIKHILKDISSLKIKSWKNDPKCINLINTYYNPDKIDYIAQWAIETINHYFKHLPDNKSLNKLLSIPPSAIKHHNIIPAKFYMNDLIIWLNPLYIYAQNQNIFTGNIKTFTCSHWPLLSGIAMLYSSLKWKLKQENIITETVFLEENKNYTVYGRISLKEIITIIKSSSIKMKSKLTYNQKAYIDNFEKNGNQKKCHTCRFKEACMTI